MVLFAYPLKNIHKLGVSLLKLLGPRLKYRRRQLRLKQKDLVGTGSASFLSKVEQSGAQPSLKNLTAWSRSLDTTMAELFGDHLVLEAAKRTIFLPEKCQSYLNLLPRTTTTDFLSELTTSASSLSTPVPTPPQDPELTYLTALVLVKRYLYPEAKELLVKALTSTQSRLWQIYLLSLLCQIQGELSESEAQRKTEEKLADLLTSLDYDKLAQALPEGPALSLDDLILLELASPLRIISTLA